jgi:DNA-binding transcriptional regulator LsrR (DeoR family)
MREPDRLKCIQGLIDKQLKQKAVAERLGLPVRQVRRLVARYELEGRVVSSPSFETDPAIDP